MVKQGDDKYQNAGLTFDSWDSSHYITALRMTDRIGLVVMLNEVIAKYSLWDVLPQAIVEQNVLHNEGTWISVVM